MKTMRGRGKFVAFRFAQDDSSIPVAIGQCALADAFSAFFASRRWST